MADWSFSNAKFHFDELCRQWRLKRSKDTVKQMTTVRVRAGRHYHRMLPYVHGGVLIADTKLEEDGMGVTDVLENGIHPGFVVGAGVEYFVARNYSLATEYGFNHINSVEVPGELVSEHVHYNALTVVFNYHF